MAKKAYIGVPVLPSGYTQIEYLESTGTQRIDTGVSFSSSNSYVIEAEACWTESKSGYSGWNAGGQFGSEGGMWHHGAAAVGGQSDQFAKITLDIPAGTSTNTTLTIEQDGTKRSGSRAHGSLASYATVNYPIFAYTNSSGGFTGYVCMRLKYLKMTVNNAVVRDYVPCTNPNGTAGLYDVANGVFYPNAGSGTFAVGASGYGIARKIKKAYIGVGKYDANTLLMLHGDLSDESVYARSVTNSGVTVSKDKSKFGGSSLYFNGSASHFTVPNLISGNTPFTVDFWAYPTAAKTHIMWSHGGSNGSWGTGGVFSFDADTTLNYFCSGYHIDGTTACPINQWHHIAVVGNGSSIKLYANGVCVGTYSSTYNFVNVDEMFGANQSATSECFTGYIDEIRVSNVARWTSNFTPPTGAYVPTDGSSGGIARKIKKAYVGIGGVARPCWSGGELAYYGTITPLSPARSYAVGASVGNYALFAGGMPTSNSHSSVVEAYDNSLTRSTPTELYGDRNVYAATTVGSIAIFGGGLRSSSARAYVESYNASLTRKVAVNGLSSARYGHAATTVGGKALFGGGYTGSSWLTSVDVFDESLTRSTGTALSKGRRYLSAATVGDYAIFLGGSDKSAAQAIADAFNTSLTRTTLTNCRARSDLAATTVGENALFAGGDNAGDALTVVDAYSSSLTLSKPAVLSHVRRNHSAVTIGGKAIFAGNNLVYGGNSEKVDIYDVSLTRTTPDDISISQPRCRMGAATVGNYALFAGGETDSSTKFANVDAFVLD